MGFLPKKKRRSHCCIKPNLNTNTRHKREDGSKSGDSPPTLLPYASKQNDNPTDRTTYRTSVETQVIDRLITQTMLSRVVVKAKPP